MIVFDGVTRRYGRKVAVSELNLTIPTGEIFAFLGPNGAGKTTAIKMLVGLLHPNTGRVTVCGYDTSSHTREAMRYLGFVPDEPHLYDKLSAREFLRFVGEMRGFTTAEAQRRIDRESERFELRDFLDDLSETYSHGMRQRTVFASAMLHDPAVLVVDEPMVGLDPKSVRLVKDMLRDHAARGATVFMSTHTLSVAEEIAGRIGIITRGRIKFLGTLDDLKSRLRAGHHSLENLFLEMTADGAEERSNGDKPREGTPLHPPHATPTPS